MARGERLDERVAREGLAESRSEARALILAGRVLVDDVPVDKAGTRIAPERSVRLKGGRRPFVSRGGEKLAGALDALGLDPRDLRCLDVGASTGGFSDCLLQRGARRVLALDVGHGQLHSRLRLDPRVESREGVNARFLSAADVPAPVDLVVVDVSFISLAHVLPALDAVTPGAEWLLLVKPQFEVGREEVGRGGVVRDDGLRRGAADRVSRIAGDLGRRELGRVDSAVAGPKGNREIFLRLSARGVEEDRGNAGGGGDVAAGVAAATLRRTGAEDGSRGRPEGTARVPGPLAGPQSARPGQGPGGAGVGGVGGEGPSDDRPDDGEGPIEWAPETVRRKATTAAAGRGREESR